ncbi:MAG: hypothetical protein J2P37_16275 [Ktedonobacteraceae bacterium]|nr:hypothetical protein [Ktedonobacteraceae bacterium]
MITSPPPAQQTKAPESPKKEVKLTPIRRRMGDAPAALFVKSLLRPIFKGIYYLLQAIRGHKLVTLGIILLLLISISVTSFATTGSLPFGIGRDPFNFSTNGGQNGGEHVRNWLYALRDGNLTQLSLIQSELAMSQPPDPQQLIAQFSQPQGHLQWKSINLIAVYTQSDTTVESFYAIDFTSPGPGGQTKGTMIWHFTTVQGRIISLDLVSARSLLQ